MGKAILVVIGIALFVYAVFDLIATPSTRVRYLPKLVWFVVLLFAPIGPLLWLYFGRMRQTSPPPSKGDGVWTPPPGPRGPDDDPDYLRNL
ncbi:MAG: hypothetical protein JWQ70_1761 [Aeromicrobium sp.]|nr:hypothetical protein [Aeromicrobium sp.]